MASTAKRGKEGTLTVNDSTGKRYVFLVKDFSDEPDMSIEKRAYIGQRTPEGDPSFDGGTITFSCDESDTQVVDLRQVIMQREMDGVAPLSFTLALREKPRALGVPTVNSVYQSCVMIPKTKSFSGQKDPISSSWEAFYKAPPRVIKQ